MTRLAPLVLAVTAACGRIDFTDRGDAGGAGSDSGSGSAADGSGSGGDPAKAIPGCVLHLAMDDTTWADGCGAHVVTAVNGATIGDDPIRGKVGVFDATLNSCLTTPDAADLDATTGLTIAAWVAPKALTTVSYGIVSKRTDYTKNNMYSLFLWADSNGAGTTNEAYADIDTENDRAADTAFAFPDGQWHQVTLTYDGTLPAASRTQFYIDGTLSFHAAETSTTITRPAMDPDLAIGCLPLSGPGQALDGALDDVALWMRPLTAAEVMAFYTATLK